MKQTYLIIDMTGQTLEMYEGTSKACQKYIKQTFHENGVPCVMKRASRADLRKEKGDETDVSNP